MKERNYKRLCFSERIIIETLLNEKRSKSYISNQLNRSRSTISREINKWVQMPRDKYDAKLAHLYATDENENKRNLDKISTFPKLKIQVYRGLLKRLSVVVLIVVVLVTIVEILFPRIVVIVLRRTPIVVISKTANHI